MLSPLGFLKLSCHFVIGCFVRPKRRLYRSGKGTSDSDDEDYRPASVCRRVKPTMKQRMKAFARMLPHQPLRKPQFSLFSYLLCNKRQPRGPSVRTPVQDPMKKGMSISNNSSQVEYEEWRAETHVGTLLPMNGCPHKNASIPTDLESHCSLSSDDYPFESSSHDGSDSLCIEDLDSDSLYSPRTSLESSTNKPGINPTFFAPRGTKEDEDDGLEVYQESETRIPIRKIHSVVERNESFKSNVQEPPNQNLLMNPAYGSSSIDKEELEVEIVTKFRSLKSVVMDGCRASSNILVEHKYIGKTLTNLTFGDPSTNESSGSESESEFHLPDDDFEELPDDSIPLIYSPTKYGELPAWEEPPLEEESDFLKWNSRRPLFPSIPVVALERAFLGTEISPNNMGTLTWRNIAYLQSVTSDEEFEERNSSRDEELHLAFVNKIPDLLPTEFDSSVLSPPGSSFAESSSFSVVEERVKENTEYEKSELKDSPLEAICFHSITPFPGTGTIKNFEDISLHSGDSTSEEDTQSDDSNPSDSAFSSSPTSPKKEFTTTSVVPKDLKASSITKTTRIVGASLKRTRWALRSLRFLVNRLDPFNQDMNKQE